MKVYFVTFRSVTHAQRGEQLLNQIGVRCNLVRTPKWMEAKGCGYSLRVRTGDIMKATDMLKGKQVPMKKVYVQSEDGVLEEVVL